MLFKVTVLFFLSCFQYSLLMGQHEETFSEAQDLAIQGNYRGAQELIEGIITKEDLNEKDRCRANYFLCRLYSNYALGNLDSSLHYLKIATSIAEEIEHDTLIATCYERLGVLYENRSQMILSLQYYQKSAAIYKAMKDEQGMAVIFSNIGIHHALQGNYEKSNQYFNQAIPIMNKIKKLKKRTAYLASTYNSLGSNAWEMGDYQKALDCYKKSGKLRKKVYPLGHSFVILDQSNIASTYYKLKMPDSAFYYLDLGITQASENANASLALLYKDYATIYLKEKEYEKASIQAHKALEYYLLVYDSPHQMKIAEVYNTLSKIATEQEEYKLALEYVQKALIANSYDFEENSTSKNPQTKEVLALDIELVSLTQKGAIYYQWYQKTQKQEHLEQAWTHLSAATQLIDSIRLEYYNDYPLLILRKKAQKTFEWTLSCLYELDQLTPQVFLPHIFSVVEQSKSYAFLARTQQQTNLQNQDDLPPILSKWRKNTEKLAFYKSQLLDEKRLNKKIDQFKKTETLLFELQEEQTQILEEIKNSLPEYYKQYFHVDYQNLGSLQASLEQDEAMLMYASGEQYLFALKVTRDKLAFEKLTLKKDIEKQIQDFRESILNKKDEIYLTEGYALYQQLLAPLDLSSNIQKISLVPATILNYVAFDALLTESVPSKAFPNYQKLPYLIKKYELSYQYSATMALDYQKKQSNKNAQLIAFAPEFSEGTYTNQLAQRSEKLISLPGSKLEVDKISAFFPSTTFVGAMATKKNFLEQIHTGNLVHLATHGLLNNEQPAYSAIAFAGDTAKVNLFYAHELYGKQLDISMLTLSACNSGVGKLNEGEGMMSLARSFALAGCPSVVMSFWEIADQSAPFIFPEFYNYLAKGMSKNRALQQAKLAYLEQSDANGAHPYYWAGIALIGNTTAVSTETGGNWLWILLGGLGLCAVLVFMYQRKRA